MYNIVEKLSLLFNSKSLIYIFYSLHVKWNIINKPFFVWILMIMAFTFFEL